MSRWSVSGEPGGLKAVAIASYPGRGEAPDAFGRLRSEVFADLGPEVQSRYEE